MTISKVISWLMPIVLTIGCKSDIGKETDSKLFTLLPPEKTGIDFVNVLEESSERYIMNFEQVYNGGGVAAGDINNDGLTDLFFTGNESPNKLYLNKGNFQFEDIAKTAGVIGGSGWQKRGYDGGYQQRRLARPLRLPRRLAERSFKTKKPFVHQ